MVTPKIWFDPALVISIRDTFGLSVFIETGTNVGDTAVWASDHFDRVITIDLHPGSKGKCEVRHYGTDGRAPNNIKFISGDSREVLGAVLNYVKSPVMFWLDAHWSGGNTKGQDAECPLLAELDTIRKHRIKHFILIDNISMFLRPPRPPHKPEQWPTIVDVCGSLPKKNYTVIVRDNMISIPWEHRQFLIDYCIKEV